MVRAPGEDGGGHQGAASTSRPTAITASKPPEATRETAVAQSRPTLCNPVDCSLPGSPVPGVFQARVLEWHAISLSRGSSRTRDRTPGLPQSHSPQKEPTKPAPSSHPLGLQDCETIHFHCSTVKEKGNRECREKSDPLSSDFRKATTPHQELRLLMQATLG